MSKTARNKGARGEREVIAILQPVVTEVYADAGLIAPELKRNLMQTNGGGFDIHGLERWAIEVKFQEQFNLTAWWEQTARQAEVHQMPVLFYRRSRIAWRIRMLGTIGDIPAVVDIDQDTFLRYFRNELMGLISA